MANSIVISDGTTSIDLYYDADGFEMLADSNEFGLAKHENLYHVSDYADGEMLVRHRLGNREWPMALAAIGGTNDATANILIAFNRLVRQARQYHTDGIGDKVYLQIQLDGATNWTRYDVVDVEYDSAAFFNWYNLRSKELVFDSGLKMKVSTKPTGYGAEEVLRNEIGTPHFEEDGNSDGLADQWNESGTPTTTLSSVAYMVGSQSQKVVTDTAGTDGVYSDTIACTAFQGQTFIAYAWVYTASGDEITLDVVGSVSGSLGTDIYSTATVTATGKDGVYTFKKLEVSSTVGGSDTTLVVRVERLTGDASEATTYYADKCYLQFGVSTAPNAWSSCANIKNHYESVTEGAIPYIDITDVPGDTEPLADINVTSISVYVNYIYIGRWSKSNNATDFEYWNDRVGVGDGDRTENAYETISVSTSWTDLTAPVVFSVDGNVVYGRYVVMMAIKNTDAITASIRIEIKDSSAIDPAYSNISRIPLTTGWTLVTSAPIHIERRPDRTVTSRIMPQMMRDSGTENAHIDFIQLIPVDEAYGIISLRNEAGALQGIILKNGDNNSIDLYSYTLSNNRVLETTTTYLGGAIRLATKEHRLVFMNCGAELVANARRHTLADGNISMSITYHPSTEFLLGTT